MSSDQQTDELQLAIDTTGPDMEVTCQDSWVIHFEHKRIHAVAHIIEFSTAVVHPRLGDAVDEAVRMAGELIAAGHMAMPDKDSQIGLSWDPLGDVYAPDGGSVSFE